MSRAAPLILLLAVGCAKGPPYAVAVISAPAGLPSACVVVEMTAGDPRSPFDQVVARDPGQDVLEVAVFQGDWPPTARLEAFVPAACGPPFVRLARSAAQDVTFAPAPPEVDLQIPDPSPVALAFVGALGPQEAGSCSPPLQLEVRDAQGAPALLSSPVTAGLTISPDIGLQLYAGDTCTAPVSSAVIGPAPSVLVRVRGAQAGSTMVHATAPGLTSAQAPVEVVAGPPTSLAVLSPSQTVLSGDCSAPVVLELHDGAGNPAPARADLPLTVQMPAAAPGFYSDPLCTVALANPVIPTGSSQVSVTFRPYTPGPATLTATAGALPAATLGVTVVPIVRRGTCTMPATNTAVQCPVAPAPVQRGRAFAFFQATNNSSSPSDSMVRCALADPPALLNCFRDPTGGAVGDVTIQWSVVELAYATVQHLTLDCGTTLPPSRVTLPRPVDPSQAFLLFSLASVGGNYADDFRAAHFEDGGTSILFENAASDCRGSWVYEAEAVELAGARVDRGTAATDAGAIAVTGLSPVDLGKSFLLYSWSAASGGNVICDRMVMGEMDSNSSLRFTLGNGNAACPKQAITVAWERVQMRYGIVQSPTITMSPGELTKSASLSPYNNSRTVAFAGGQAVGGQGGGQSAYAQDDLAAEAIARHSLNSSTLTLARDSADAGSKWRPYVVEFQP